uniref:TRAF-type domain-containing protein n=1 Tax=Meloidogyne javanica TaxID=6303 RepID=A0A915LXQ8_MELJA
MFIEPTIIDKSFPTEHVHCVNCIKLNCKQGDLCPLIHCNFCGVRLHKCKLEDHIEHICGKAPCNCPNTIYGCNVRLRRQLIAEHIAFCCASIVFCPFVRNRQFYSAKAKKLLKRIARTGEKIFPENEKTMEELNELEVPDIAIALIDQENKNKKIREPFAGCRLCKLDPGSQHLHQLGSMKENKENGDFEQKKKNILKLFDNNSILSFLPEFYRKRSLLVTPNIPFLSIVLGEEYLSVNYPIFGCSACYIPRSQFNSHYASHNILDESTPYNFIARCPNWQRGCSFKMNTYNSFLSACVYEPMPNLPILMRVPTASSSGLFLAEMPSHFYLLIARWMDDASLRTLSVTCSRMYQLLPKLLPHRLCVEIKWKKERVVGDGFVGNRFYESFSAVQGSIPSLIVQPQGPIIDHLQNCDYRDVYDLGIEPIELKKVHGSFASAN